MVEKEQLEKMIEDGFSERKISYYLSVSHSTVRYWLNKYGLRSKY
jgi:transposase